MFATYPQAKLDHTFNRYKVLEGGEGMHVSPTSFASKCHKSLLPLPELYTY
jgi:hypothetical protein